MSEEYWIALKFVGIAVAIVFFPWLALLLVYIGMARRIDEREAEQKTEETKTQ